MKLEELLEEWERDCELDSDHLDRSSVRTPQLHAKYLKFLSQHKMRYSALEAEYKTLRQRKFRYYRGEMSRDELKELEWDQWQGVKPLRNEMDEFLNGDDDLNKIEMKCSYLKTMVDALESILKQLAARDWQIRNAIEWNKFVAGN